MNRRFIDLAAIAVGLAVLVVLLVLIQRDREACEARGGVLVRSAIAWYDCVKPIR